MTPQLQPLPGNANLPIGVVSSATRESGVPSAVRAFTIIEMIICVLILSLIGVCTAEVLGQGRVLRENASHRAELALLAQSELDRLRTVPLPQLVEGPQPVTREPLPPSVSVGATVRKRPDGYLELAVTARRATPGGEQKVELTSIHPGGRR